MTHLNSECLILDTGTNRLNACLLWAASRIITIGLQSYGLASGEHIPHWTRSFQRKVIAHYPPRAEFFSDTSTITTGVTTHR